ncbi:type I-E CRISPR-associated protein Cas5/CasD [Nocardia brasiliensis]|uniref:type I-E CRISPR-associated protein Cas5/CasD n=1 Tax=Nocardia brasiliensis TaxID=37326 RepID=UPI00189362A2|nr:type I-E CRISPR-associated protein Cas5/CasD [Nocardia brasiliensis]MBF6125566.1 type I-E CRISPR-associated protein Cas5/CasD [Nocardia brasiliensis]
MSVVALRLAGPLQSWGASSKFVRRDTENAPTKSGVLGLVAAAKGLRRTDPLESLLGLRFGVRIDQPGQLVRDFHTAQRPKRERDGSTTWTSLPLSYRYYISDAVYLAVLEGEHQLIAAIDAAVRSPQFPLYLGRRSCPPAGPIALGVFDTDLQGALTTVPWLASIRNQKRARDTLVTLATVRDAAEDELTGESIQDNPVSFDPNHRQYEWRNIVRNTVDVPNPHGTTAPVIEHDAMSVLEA